LPEQASRLPQWLLLAAAVIALDQASKLWVWSSLGLGNSLTLLPVFDLVCVLNPGASFSLLADAGGWQRWLFTGLALAVSAWLLAMLRRHAAERLLPAALALILGGAVGNVIDRIRLGAVIDFIQVHAGGAYFPAFNVADSAITVGVILMLGQQFLSGDKTHA
jgi:signal peptidase II